MIEVELRRVPEGHDDYQTVATLSVDDDGSPTVHDPEGFLPLELPVLVVSDAGELRRVSFADDPATFARHLDSILRTGYLVPVVTADSDPQHHG